MKQFAVIGLGAFGIRIVEELAALDVELLVVDKDKDLVERHKALASVAYCMDVLNRETIQKVIPESIDAVIVDLGDSVEASIMVTNILKKHGIREIIVKAESDEHAEILRTVGASRVVFPDREAAKRIVPLLVSDTLFNFLPISPGLVVAEVHVPATLVGKTLLEADVRKVHGVNIVAMKENATEEYDFVSPQYCFKPEDVLLITGREDKVIQFSGIRSAIRKRGLKTLLARLAS